MQTFNFRTFGMGMFAFKAFGTPGEGDGLIALPSVLTLSLAGGPQTVVIRDASGGALSSSKTLAARADVTKPGYVAVSRYFVGGNLVVTPVAIGSGTITVVYGDQVNDEFSVAIPFTVAA